VGYLRDAAGEDDGGGGSGGVGWWCKSEVVENRVESV